MRRKYWWFNLTGSYEILKAEKFIWSPKVETDGDFNQGYFNMTQVQIGDIFFVISAKSIMGTGIIMSQGYDYGRPPNFPDDLNENAKIGRRVEVDYFEMNEDARTPIAELIDIFKDSKKSPFTKTGGAKHKIFLNPLSIDEGRSILEILNVSNNFISRLNEADEKDRLEEDTIHFAEDESETTRKAVYDARIGQGRFREDVSKIERCCRITKIDKKDLLIASHIKPWRESSNKERLDGYNGLFLTPNIDKLFDKYLLSFENNGDVMISKSITQIEREVFGLIDGMNVGVFHAYQSFYLEFHRSRFHDLETLYKKSY